MLEFLIKQFYENDFFTAAVVAAPMTAFAYTVRALPSQIFAWAKRVSSIDITFNSDMGDYTAVQTFIARNVASDRWSRTYVYSSRTIWDEGEPTIEHNGLTLGYGQHIGWYRNTFVWINRVGMDSQTEKFKENLTITFLSRSRALVAAFAKEIEEHSRATATKDMIRLFVSSSGYWRLASQLPKRDPSTVFTKDDALSEVLEHLRSFVDSRDLCRKRGTPWHTGVLLTGKPGTGKTSLIHATASALGRSIFYLNLGGVTSDQQLTDLVSSGRDWSRSILVIEDADAAGAQVNRDIQPADHGENPPVTLSALLNVLDGLMTPDGLIVMVTSNHPERLDPALIRKGRFDLQIELGDLDWKSYAAMARLFGVNMPDNDPARESYKPISGAEARARFMETSQ